MALDLIRLNELCKLFKLKYVVYMTYLQYNRENDNFFLKIIYKNYFEIFENYLKIIHRKIYIHKGGFYLQCIF